MNEDKTDFIVIAVDGGAATGKSSTSRGVSKLRELLHVDTGSHYRAITWHCLQAKISSESAEDLKKLLSTIEFSNEINGNSSEIVINGQKPADEELRSDSVNASVSAFAAIPQIRDAIKGYQRSQKQLAQKKSFKGLIMEGRDIGSVIFPDADLKIYLEADEATRSARRANEGQTDSITARDKQDSSRKTAPLKRPEGARIVDTSKRSLKEVIEHISEMF